MIPATASAPFLRASAFLRRFGSVSSVSWDAVKRFSPYASVQEVKEPLRQGLRELVDMAVVDGTPAFIFVNNRLEGNSPGTIVSITD